MITNVNFERWEAGHDMEGPVHNVDASLSIKILTQNLAGNL